MDIIKKMRDLRGGIYVATKYKTLLNIMEQSHKSKQVNICINGLCAAVIAIGTMPRSHGVTVHIYPTTCGGDRHHERFCSL